MRGALMPTALLMLIPALAAAWETNGVLLTRADFDQGLPMIASDGAGGAFVSWVDYALTDLFVQRVTASGAIAKGWPANGVRVATGPNFQFAWSLAPDGEGGVLIGIADGSTDEGNIYLQRITSSGAVATGWPSGGVPVSTQPGLQSFVEVIADGTGGAFISWLDEGLPFPRGYVNHFSANGSPAPGWSAEGRQHEPNALIVARPRMLADGRGGLLACWSAVDSPNFATSRLLAQHYSSDGTPDPSWPTGGSQICTELPRNRPPQGRLVTNGAGGFYAVWHDARASLPMGGSDFDIYAQHVLANGTTAPGWPADALPVCALAGTDQDNPSITEDGQGGVYIGWTDQRLGYQKVYLTHLNASGQRHPGWPENGRPISSMVAFQFVHQLEPDGAGGAYMSWLQFESSGFYRSYIQHLQSNGQPAPGWPENGLAVSSLRGDQDKPVLVRDGAGGAIVAWEDSRNYAQSSYDIYAQRFVPDGPVAVTVSLVSADASPADVRLHWRVIGEAGATVERRVADGAWQSLARVTADGEGNLRHTDTDVTPGERYEYRLAFASGERGGETTVTVPASLQLALEGARPNPARGAPAIAFTLPAPGPARLELLDVSGRRVASRELASLGAGRHVLRVDDAPLSPGLYWAVLTHAGRTLRAKVAIVE